MPWAWELHRMSTFLSWHQTLKRPGFGNMGASYSECDMIALWCDTIVPLGSLAEALQIRLLNDSSMFGYTFLLSFVYDYQTVYIPFLLVVLPQTTKLTRLFRCPTCAL